MEQFRTLIQSLKPHVPGVETMLMWTENELQTHSNIFPSKEKLAEDFERGYGLGSGLLAAFIYEKFPPHLELLNQFQSQPLPETGEAVDCPLYPAGKFFVREWFPEFFRYLTERGPTQPLMCVRGSPGIGTSAFGIYAAHRLAAAGVRVCLALQGEGQRYQFLDGRWSPCEDVNSFLYDDHSYAIIDTQRKLVLGLPPRCRVLYISSPGARLPPFRKDYYAPPWTLTELQQFVERAQGAVSLVPWFFETTFDRASRVRCGAFARFFFTDPFICKECQIPYSASLLAGSHHLLLMHPAKERQHFKFCFASRLMREACLDALLARDHERLYNYLSTHSATERNWGLDGALFEAYVLRALKKGGTWSLTPHPDVCGSVVLVKSLVFPPGLAAHRFGVITEIDPGSSDIWIPKFPKFPALDSLLPSRRLCFLMTTRADQPPMEQEAIAELVERLGGGALHIVSVTPPGATGKHPRLEGAHSPTCARYSINITPADSFPAVSHIYPILDLTDPPTAATFCISMPADNTRRLWRRAPTGRGGAMINTLFAYKNLQ
ncbi:hypothetical protein PAPYR_5819 [Paratrimastix pyriformis]|uniref:Uncharacterized protein n=1 Tax=Paratrimastix pyriformis TaxID=342808 RepID=A0ABQ8UKE9_9EUKA|nr:hypothetical protein PAPYR_5819 [Paratrimastix pyriformis]